MTESSNRHRSRNTSRRSLRHAPTCGANERYPLSTAPGLRIVDVADPLTPREVGCFIPSRSPAARAAATTSMSTTAASSASPTAIPDSTSGVAPLRWAVHSSGIPALRRPTKKVASYRARNFGTPKYRPGLQASDGRIMIIAEPLGFHEFGKGAFGFALEGIGGGEVGVNDR